jgi:hypothetical protein
MDDEKARMPHVIPLSEAERKKLESLKKGESLNLFRVLPRSVFYPGMTSAQIDAIKNS